MLKLQVCEPNSSMMTLAGTVYLGSGMRYTPVVNQNNITIPRLENNRIIWIAKCNFQLFEFFLAGFIYFYYFIKSNSAPESACLRDRKYRSDEVTLAFSERCCVASG